MAGGQLVMGDVQAGPDNLAAAGEGSASTEPPAARGRDRPRRERRLAVAGVLVAMLLGCTLRAIWADAYLPWQHHWDEITNVEVGEAMAAEGAIDPGFYNYPALVFLAQSAVLVPARVFSGYDPDDAAILDTQTAGSAHVDEPGLLAALRWATGVVPGVVMVGAAGAIAWLAGRRWWVATLAATIAAVSAIDLRFGIVVTPDVLTGMASTLAALGAAAITLRPSRRTYLLTGAAIGLAGAAKYNGVAVAIGLLTAHLLVHRRPLAERRPLIEAGLVALVVFGVANLGAVLHPYELVRGIGSEANHYSTGHFGNQGSSPVFNAGWLWRAFGLAVPLAACSLLATSDRVRRIGIVLLAQVAGYYIFVSLFPVRFARNLLPITGPLAAAAALGVLALLQRLAQRQAWATGTGRRRALAGGVAAVLALGALAVPVTASAAAMRSLDEDPWSEAQAWIDEHVPAGSKIAVETRAPVVDDDRYEVVVKLLLGTTPFWTYRFTGVDYVVGVSETFQPYFDAPDDYPARTESYRQLLAPECVVAEFEGAGQRIVIASPARC